MDIENLVGLLVFTLYAGFVIIVAKFHVVSSWLDKHEEEPPNEKTVDNQE